jgi:hypothetical protein
MRQLCSIAILSVLAAACGSKPEAAPAAAG